MKRGMKAVLVAAPFVLLSGAQAAFITHFFGFWLGITLGLMIAIMLGVIAGELAASIMEGY